MTPQPVQPIAKARTLLGQARSIVVFSGAGMSAESGVPTFRGSEGLWRTYRPEQLATPSAFAADARLVWEWYEWRRALVSKCSPNAGHHAIARAQCDGRRTVRVVTQNVDGLHGLALDEVERSHLDQAITELHGSLFVVRCSQCSYSRTDRKRIDATAFDTLPRCPKCESLLRPGVVWFGEALDHDQLEFAFQTASEADVCVVVGTSAVVEPAASIPRQTVANGGSVIEINPQATPLSEVAEVVLTGSAADLLPRLFAPEA